MICMNKKELSKISFNKKTESCASLELLNIGIKSVEMHMCKKARSSVIVSYSYSDSDSVVIVK
jgi:hypothetical protein